MINARGSATEALTSMGKEPINPPTVFRSLDFGFSQAIVTTGRRTVYLSGQVAWDADRKIVGGANLESQAIQAFRNLQAVVEAAGGSLADVVSVRIYIVDYGPAKAAAVGGAFRSCFSGMAPPAATWVGVAALAEADFLIEVEAVAVLD